MNWKRIVLALGAIEITVVGTIYLFAPKFMMASNGMSIASVNEFHTVRAGYGGLFVAFGLLFGAGSLRLSLERPALIAMAVFMGGFAAGRIFSILVDGVPGAPFFAILASEILLGAASLILLKRGAART